MAGQAADLQQLAEKLCQLGCSTMDMSECLSPGSERVRVVIHLLQTLVQPVPLEQLLARMESEDSALQHLAPDERSAYKHAALLTSVGLQASPDQVRGSASYQDSLSFLTQLVNTITMQQELRAGGLRAAGPGNPGSPSAQGPIPLPPLPHHSSAKLLEYVCDRTPALLAENVPLFPSDITKACQPHSEQTLELLRHQPQLAAALQQGVRQLQSHVEDLSQQVHPCTDEEWSTAHQACISAASQFMNALNTFLGVYHKELGVWCECSQRPETHGFGQQADAMLDVHGRLSDLLAKVDAVRRMHAAITVSAPPLQDYVRQDMLQLVVEWQQEACRMSKEVDVLNRARSRLASSFYKPEPQAA